MYQSEAIQQYRSLRVTREYAVIGHRQASAMQDIAMETEQKTASMNIITIATLIFLPPTFVAVSLALLHYLSRASPKHKSLTTSAGQTFFQAGLLTFQTPPEKFDGPWLLEWSGFWLFIGICLPLLVIVFGFWHWLRRRLAKRARERLHYGGSSGDV